MRRLNAPVIFAAMAFVSAPITAAAFPQPLAVDPQPSVVTLPAKYPQSWVMVHDFYFMSIPDGRVAIVDTASPAHNLKGVVSSAQFGNFLPSTTKSELYSAETYYSRLARGVRTDVITIWDKATLQPKGEIILPGGKRSQSVTVKNSFQFTNDEKWALVFNFTPGASVTVVDLEARKILADIDTPGCSQIYPTGERGFTTLCSDGTMTTIALGADGKAGATTTSSKVNEIDNDAMFMMPTMVGKTAWFATFKGNIHGIDLSGAVARDLGSFAIAPASGGTPEWRPSGWQLITSDAAGRLYVLMNSNGREGGHKDGGTEVWVIDPVKKLRLQRLVLKAPAVSIEATKQPVPTLVAARPTGELDIYDAASGKLTKSLGGTITLSPMTMTAVQ